MEERRQPTAAIAVSIGLLVPALLLAVYVVGYFALPIRHPAHRQFPERWQAEMYRPAAAIEEFLTGQDMNTCSG
ncbi:MAG: hypothetical protein SFU86_16815 [Pirellulaceae bacterium]|nr:hypothetical protein [Pirellulaceae bacterium]